MAVRGQLRWQPTDTLDINMIGDYTDDDRTTAGTVLLDRPFNGVQVARNFNNPARDIDPFTPNSRPAAKRIPLDTRFLCGPYCNYASYSSPADGTLPLRSPMADQVRGLGRLGPGRLGASRQDPAGSITAYRRIPDRLRPTTTMSRRWRTSSATVSPFGSFSQELRLNGRRRRRQLEYTLGGFYRDQRSVYPSTRTCAMPACRRSAGRRPVNADTKAVFAHVAVTPFDPLTLTGGCATPRSTRPTHSPPDPIGGVLAPPLGPLDGRPATTTATLRLSRERAVRDTDDVMGYVQYSTGFKGGGVNPRPFFPQQALPFGPETLDSYELGFKSDFSIARCGSTSRRSSASTRASS